MKKVLVLINYYLPGFKAGGPIRSVSNMVERFQNEFEFWIFTRDRDLGDEAPYEDVSLKVWNHVGNQNVYYCSSSSWQAIRRVVREVSPQIVYLNSFYADFTIKYLVLRKSRLIPQIPTIVAPRGVFSPGALRIRRLKKLSFIKLTYALGLYQNVLWHASSRIEAREIQAVLGKSNSIHVAPNLPSAGTINHNLSHSSVKLPGSAKFIFLSRISPKKNLLGGLLLLKDLTGKVEFSIVGPVDDNKYWTQCQEVMQSLPANVEIHYLGAISPDKVVPIMNQNHFFLFPTLGENFGHVILEALIAGCPVIISDQTPWHNLKQQGVGWDLSLDSEGDWVQILQHCIDMEHNIFAAMRQKAQEFASKYVANSDIYQANEQLFQRAQQR